MQFLKKPTITLVGALLVLAGVIMLVTPGPGLVVIAAGLAVWATEYAFARRWLEHVRARLHAQRVRIEEKLRSRRDDDA